MYKTAQKICILFLLTASAAAFPTQNASAASISMSASAQQIPQNSTTVITVSVDTSNQPTYGTYAAITFDSSKFEFVSAATGGFYPTFVHRVTGGNKVVLSGYTGSFTDSRSGTGTLGSFTLKAIASSGAHTLSFVCTNTNESDTIIYNASGTQNLLNCANTNTFTLTIPSSGGTNNTSTPTPTSTLTPTLTPTLTGGTTTANTPPVCAKIQLSPTSGSTADTFSIDCMGTDYGGYINAVEFDFGDNQKQVVEKNVGSPGTISTTHKYNYVGTFGVSCRVRDNDGAWSGVPGDCKRVVSISQAAAQATPTKKTTARTPTPTKKVSQSPSPTTNPRPTAQTVSFTKVSPTPLEFQRDDAGVSPAKAKSFPLPELVVFTILGFLGLTLIIYAYKKYKENQTPPSSPKGPVLAN